MTSRHLGFMQIAKVTESCRLDNQAELLRGSDTSIKLQKH